MSEVTCRAPARVQRRRTPGWRAPVDRQGRPVVYVGRPTRWANPYRVGPDLPAAAVVAAYLADLLAGRLPVTVADVRRELAGRDLSCWCPPGPCHADVLLDVAAGGTR